MDLPILYSFRRCPYAMRARLALAFIGQGYELREVDLKNKPQSMLDASPKGTVPVMIFSDGNILEESLDIVEWAVENDRKGSLIKLEGDINEAAHTLVTQFMKEFVPNLNRYKYPDRYDLDPGEDPKAPLDAFLDKLEADMQKTNQKFLFGDKPSFADIALFPLIRQMRIVDEEQFDSMQREAVLKWFHFFLNHQHFEKIMEKFDPWQRGQGKIISFSA